MKDSCTASEPVGSTARSRPDACPVSVVCSSSIDPFDEGHSSAEA